MTTHWTDYTPKEAAELHLNLAVRTDIWAPLNEAGERCPWPWEPQQLVGMPIGMYHCAFCGAMVLAGVPHIDYADPAAAAKRDAAADAQVSDDGPVGTQHLWGYLNAYERRADPEGRLSRPERRRRAEGMMREHMARLAQNSARARFQRRRVPATL